MRLGPANRRSLTLVQHLTLWYTGAFSLSLAVIFASFYYSIKANIRKEDDGERAERARELVYVLDAGNMEAVKQEIVREIRTGGAAEGFIRILHPDGKTYYSSDISSWPGIGVNHELLQKAENGGVLFETVTFAERKDPVRILYTRLTNDLMIQLGESLANEKEVLARYKQSFLLASLAVIVIATVLGGVMAKKAMQRVAAITETAMSISDTSLGLRVPVAGGNDELDLLACAFNKMLDRIELLVNGIRMMIDNLSHELRTPMTRLRGAAEMTLTSSCSSADYQNLAAGIIEEVDRLLRMINTMLDISEAEAGTAKMIKEKLDLTELLNQAFELMNPLAEEKQVSLTLEAPGQTIIAGDVGKLQRAFSNILDNAIKYTPRGGNISITLGQEAGSVQAVFRDSGIGIAAADLPHVFDRFYRGNGANQERGSGLGLSLTRAIIEAHSGSITVASSRGQGTIVNVVLPAAADYCNTDKSAAVIS